MYLACKRNGPQEKHRAMYLAARCLPTTRPSVTASVDREIRDFVAGRTDGDDLFHALYDHVLDEPVPPRLRALLKS